MITTINEFRKINENNTEDILLKANDILVQYKNGPGWNNVITWFNENDIEYNKWTDLEMLSFYLNNEDVQESIKENQEPVKKFTNATGDGGADYYRWEKPENKTFWSKLTLHVLDTEKESNPNGYISALSPVKQQFLVDIANEMLKTDNVIKENYEDENIKDINVKHTYTRAEVISLLNKASENLIDSYNCTAMPRDVVNSHANSFVTKFMKDK